MDDDHSVFLLCLLLPVITAVGSIAWASGISTSSWQRKAVDAGHAEFFINEDGGRAWRWKECE